MKDRILMLGLAGLAVVATAGWMRQPKPFTEHAAAASYAQGANPVVFGTPLTEHATVQPQAFNMPVRSAPVRTVYREAPVREQSIPVTASRTAPQAEPVEVYREPELKTRPDEQAATVENRPEPPVIQKRSKKKSAVIIAGGAAAGAAIGGLAGGGKGAAIGALSGGAAGLVYDRMTHKKRVPADQGTYNYRTQPYR